MSKLVGEGGGVVSSHMIEYDWDTFICYTGHLGISQVSLYFR